MRELVYHVAVSVDGFIAREDGTAGDFLQDPGPHVDDYLAALQKYDTVLMGRKTYEFGYDFGLQPGRAAYSHMRNYVFSASLVLPEERDDNLIQVQSDPGATVRSLKQEDGPPVYLCGGGALAGTLFEEGLVDRLLLKVNPILLGRGIGLFGGRTVTQSLRLEDRKVYENGIQLLDYRLV